MLDGVLNIYKEKGFTSHDVVAKMRGILHQKKIGHTGTLDPDAEGVLPVCLGQGTRLCDMLTDHSKAYRAVLLLGVDTDTQDISGQILEKRPVEENPEQVLEVIKSFIGPYDQVPPMYSALKVDGKRLYELARAGKTVERQARPVVIHDITVESIELPRVTMTVSCSKGTYIRTLCHDIGEKLGCGGCMEALMRTRVGRFELKNSISLSELEKIRDAGCLGEYLVSVEEMFLDQPRANALPEADSLVHNGNPVKPESVSVAWERGETEADGANEPGPEAAIASETAASSAAGQKTYVDQQLFRMYDSEDHFLGVYRYEKDRKWLKPWKMFLGGN